MREGLGGSPEGEGGVKTSSRGSGSGREVLLEVREGSGGPLEVREGSGPPFESLGGVGNPSQR